MKIVPTFAAALAAGLLLACFLGWDGLLAPGDALADKEASGSGANSAKRVENLGTLSKKLSARLEKLEGKLGVSTGPAGWDLVSKRLEQLEEKIGSSRGSAEWDSVSRRLEKLEGKIGPATMDALSRRLEKLESKMGLPLGSAGWGTISRRLDKLEDAAQPPLGR